MIFFDREENITRYNFLFNSEKKFLLFDLLKFK